MKRILSAAGAVFIVIAVIIGLFWGAVSDAAGAVSFLFSDGFRDWLSRNAVPAFWVGLGIILALVVAIEATRRHAATVSGEKSALEAEVKNLQESLKRSNLDSAKLLDASREESSRLRVRVAELEAVPADYDIEKFSRFVTEIPPDGMLLTYLKQWFGGKCWEWAKIEDAENIIHNWGMAQFVDNEMSRLLSELREACSKFVGAIAANTFKVDPDEPRTCLREDYFDDFMKYEQRQQELRELGDAVVEVHSQLVEYGHRRSMYRRKADR
ncbi:hypothetical protein ACIA5D_51405 [Actinoplanes sp. NPDC051513]|uniref:hypothetical protein n=1 Tax=Actinoplanes sp. NPDC051513 TaxID=3363908 RepID=UPI00378ACEE4